MKLFNLLAKPFGWILSWIYNLIGNYGISLIIFTIAICAAMIPLYSKQIKSSSRMSEIQPKVQEIQVRYANNRELQNQKLQELYQKENYNPTQGCLPLFLQMFIIFGLFAMLRNPLSYINNEALQMGVHEKFIWINDLSQPDPWILPILTAVGQFLQSKVSQPAQPQQTGAAMTKMMLYFFPMMILWLGKSMPAGLCLYWFLRSVFSIFQSMILNKGRQREILRMEVEKELKK